jgi:UPF0755 protein
MEKSKGRVHPDKGIRALYMEGNRIRRRAVKGILFSIAVLVVIAAVLTLAAVSMNRPTGDILSDETIFRIDKGESLSSIAKRLEDDRLIRSSFFMKTLSRIQRTDNGFKTGSYRVPRGSTTMKIHDLLVSGVQNLVKVTIPEGWTIKKIAALLDQRGIVGKDEFIAAAFAAETVNDLFIPGDSVEGYLFPDTYFFPEGHSAGAVIKEMVEQFNKNVGVIEPDYAGWKRKDLHTHVILASIVEREYRIAEEAPYIASVFKNRVAYNIGLESCATVEYIITEIENKKHPSIITLEDTRIDSPYNTYKWHGLPPGPISNPGRVALNAVFHTPETDLYYFVLRDPSTGEHYFSEDLGEHNQAKVFYLKGEGRP